MTGPPNQSKNIRGFNEGGKRGGGGGCPRGQNGGKDWIGLDWCFALFGRCTWDGLYLDSDVLPDTITLSGLWYAAHGTDNSPLPHVQRRAIIHRVVQALAAAVPDLPTILDEWAALQPRLQAPPCSPQQPLTVSVDKARASLTWEYSIIIASLVRGLVKWRVRCSGPL